ncbi:MAG: hypothetical protein HOG06_07600 [Lentimicrobiaceae bacterium]|jgi:Hypothetical protein|nr:hypothetical protein [Lentimicrobiaceae bacterium]MCP4911334.1 hypothetical protein [Bacteroidota bacterium]
MRVLFSVLSLLLIIGLTSCNQDNKSTDSRTTKSNFDYSGIVKEVIQTTNYTYCFVNTNNTDYWIAISKLNINEGEVIYYNKGLEMLNFHSKELDRTFSVVYFVQKASKNPNSGIVTNTVTKDNLTTKPKIDKKNFSYDKAFDGITISDLYANRDKYANKKVRIRGRITKFNSSIMSRNWAHIQDGTDNNGNFDLTVTTQETVNIDELVTFEGTIALDKDFGAGYFYPIIMEEAVIIK